MGGQPIQVSELDRNFKLEVYPQHDPRKIARMVNLGMRERALSGPYIWYCSDCWICEQRCPQNVKRLAHLVTALCRGCGVCGAACPSRSNLGEPVRR